MSDAAQPTDVRGLPRAVYVSRDRIVRAVNKKRVRISRPSEVRRGRQKGGEERGRQLQRVEAEEAQIRNPHL